MFFQRAVIVFAMALTTLAQSVVVSPSVCVVYTVIESTFPIEACFTANTIISIESVTPVSVTNAPTCITTIVTASTTLSAPASSTALLSETLSTILESLQATETQGAMVAPMSQDTSNTGLSSLGLSTPVAITTSASVGTPTTITSTTPMASSTTILSSIPPSLTCSVPPPAPTRDGTTPYCCLWYIVQSSDICDIITSKSNITAGTIYELNPELLADCYNLAEGSAYCVFGSPQIIPAPTLFYIFAEDSGTAADTTFLMGGHSDHAIMGFKFPWVGEVPLTFTYDPVTGYLETEGYNVYATQFTDAGPLFLVTYLAADAAVTPNVFPLVCIVTLASKLYCNVEGGADDRFYLYDYAGELALGLGSSQGSSIAAVDLFLEIA